MDARGDGRSDNNAGARVMEATQYRYRCDSTRLRMVSLVESSGDALPDALMKSGVIVVTYEFDNEAM
jgi:hypothetical protein